MDEILLVDGYNVIGAMETSFTGRDLDQARHWLVDQLADYQAYTGVKVYVIFDAHRAPGPGQSSLERGVKVIYTKENETADECIERLVRRLKQSGRQIVVATSDYLEQRITFGAGALRRSARELLKELDEINREIETEVRTHYARKRTAQLPLTNEMAKIFEKWRRGE